MVFEEILSTARIIVSILILAFSILAVYYGAKTVKRFRGEFGIGVKWITFGFTILIATQIVSPFNILFSTAPVGELVITVFSSTLAVGAFAMIVYGYKKIYELIAQIS